jgi:rubrerythrin
MPHEDLRVDPGLASPNLGADHKIHGILHSALKRHGLNGLKPGAAPSGYWPAEHFGLNRVKAFQGATEAQKSEVLKLCSTALLEEAYYIEKGGMYYTAKMGLMAESTEERMIFNLFSAEETSHFQIISSCLEVNELDHFRSNPFLSMMSDICQNEGRTVLLYILQIVLEGWGIHHYHALAETCSDPYLKESFRMILKDEAKHHGSGLILFNENEASERDRATLKEILTHFFKMVQVGPQIIVGSLDRVIGLTRQQRVKTFAELDCQAQTARKIQVLKDCIISANHSAEVIGHLESHGSLQAYPPEVCASI